MNTVHTKLQAAKQNIGVAMWSLGSWRESPGGEGAGQTHGKWTESPGPAHYSPVKKARVHF